MKTIEDLKKEFKEIESDIQRRMQKFAEENKDIWVNMEIETHKAKYPTKSDPEFISVQVVIQYEIKLDL